MGTDPSPLSISSLVQTPSPRVLILSDEGPQSGTAGGMVLQRLFARHPPERLRVLAHYVPTLGDPLPGVVYRHLPTPWRRFESSRFNRWMRSLRAFGMTPPVPLRRIASLLDGFTPDVVFCVMQHAAYYDTAHRFARLRCLPLVVAVHDVNEEFDRVLPWALAAARRRDGEFYRYARERLCVSPAMEQRCADLYHAPGSILYPNRDETLRPRPFAYALTTRHPDQLTLGFAGNLDYGYGLGLLQHLPALREAKVRLVIYGRPPRGAAAPLAQATDCCEFRGFTPTSAEAWAGIQRDCDAVWLPYPDPAGEMEPLYRYHFPSKLPEYLALGLPVIVTGPAYATGVAWSRRQLDSAVTLDRNDHGGLVALLRRLHAAPAWRQQLAEQAWQAGQQDFDPVKITVDFHARLARAASAPKYGS